MFKKIISVCFIAALVFGIFAGCANSSGGGKVVEDFTVTADYSQITVKWEPENEDTKYFVYVGKNKDERPQESVWWGWMTGNVACRHVVEEPGRYYVWVQTEKDGPISEPKAIDVKFIDPVTNVTVTTTLLGFKVSWTSPTETGGIDLIQVGYKKAGGDWKYLNTNGLAVYTNLNGVEDGSYTFKVLVCDKYNTKVSSDETSAYNFSFDNAHYGNKPNSGTEFTTSLYLRDLTGDADYYYFSAEKGKHYDFNVLDWNSYDLARIDQSSWGSIDTTKLISAKVEIYISGSCPVSDSDTETALKEAGLVASKSYFSKTNYTLYFNCERDAYYIVKVSKASSYHQPTGSYNQYGLSWKTY